MRAQNLHIFQYISLILLFFRTYTKQMRGSKMQAFANHGQAHPVNDREFRRRMSPIRRRVEERKSIRERRFSCGFMNQGCMGIMAGLQIFHGGVRSGASVAPNIRPPRLAARARPELERDAQLPGIDLDRGQRSWNVATCADDSSSMALRERPFPPTRSLSGAFLPSAAATAGHAACLSRSAFAPRGSTPARSLAEGQAPRAPVQPRAGSEEAATSALAVS